MGGTFKAFHMLKEEYGLPQKLWRYLHEVQDVFGNEAQ